MSMSEELARLAELHQRGALSDAEFARAKSRVLEPMPSGRSGSAVAALNMLHRSRDDRWLGGVCGGLAELTGITAWLWRAIFALAVLCAGTGIAIYLLLWIFVPDAANGEQPSPRMAA